MRGAISASGPAASGSLLLAPGQRSRAGSIQASVALVFGLLSAAVAVPPAYAQEWSVQPTASLGLRYSDNARSTAAGQEGSFIGDLRAAVRAARSTEASDIGLTAGVGLSWYDVVPDLNNTSGFIRLDTSLQAERNLYRLNAQFDSQSTLTSETATSGLNQFNKQRNQWALSPAWTYLLSERASVGIGLNYTNVSYADVGQVPLQNYWTGTASLSGDYRLTERGGVTVRLEYGRYESPASGQNVAGSKYDNLGAQIGADYLLSETLSAAVLIGIRRTDATLAGPDGGSVSNSSSGPSYIVSLAKRLANGGGINFRAARELAPSGAGQVLDNTSVNFGLSYPLSERWSCGFSLTGSLNRSPGGGTEKRDNNKTVSAAPRISYQLTPTWTLATGYTYSWQDRQAGTGAAQTNEVYLTLAWTRPWDL